MGLIPYKFGGKIQLLSEMAHEQNALIVSLTETHLMDEKNEAKMQFSNYVHFRTDI